MTRAIQPAYFGRTTFCEDVRLEQTGQLTIIGVFNGGLSLQGFPSALPKLGLVIEFQQAYETEVLPVILRVFAPGNPEPIFEYEHTVEAILAASELAPPASEFAYPGPRVRRLVQVAVLSIVEVRESGFIFVRGFRGDEVLAMGALPITSEDVARQTN